MACEAVRDTGLLKRTSFSYLFYFSFIRMLMLSHPLLLRFPSGKPPVSPPPPPPHVNMSGGGASNSCGQLPFLTHTLWHKHVQMSQNVSQRAERAADNTGVSLWTKLRVWRELCNHQETPGSLCKWTQPNHQLMAHNHHRCGWCLGNYIKTDPVFMYLT